MCDKAKCVTGVDNSGEQLRLAREEASRHSIRNASFWKGDIFSDYLPKSDVTLAPFVLNYSESVDTLRGAIQNIYKHLSSRGRAVFVVDLPNLYSSHPYERRKSWGAVKWWCGPVGRDGTLIQNKLFNLNRREVCVLWAHYFSQQTIQFVLQDIGFKEIEWHRPVISEEGFETFGSEFWEGYLNDPELGYITAKNKTLTPFRALSLIGVLCF